MHGDLVADIGRHCQAAASDVQALAAQVGDPVTITLLGLAWL